MANTTGLSPHRVHAALETAYGGNGTGQLPYGPSSEVGASDPPASRNTASPPRLWGEGGSSFNESTTTAWTPCDGCKGEVQKLIRQKTAFEAVIRKIGRSFMFI